VLDPNGGCVTPSDLFSDQAEKQAIEREIERIIIGDFMGSKAASGAIDIFTDPGVNGPRAVTEWLSRNSFGQTLNTTKMMQGFNAGLYSVPDIITNRVTNAKSEFYEIKPNSAPGKAEGLRKLVAFALLDHDFHLLFFPGVDYDPTAASLLRSIHQIGATEYELQLNWWRDAPGLVLYEICYKVKQKVEVKQETPIAGIALALLLALLVILLLKGLRGNPGGLGQPITTA
jgi:hypothetical protein